MNKKGSKTHKKKSAAKIKVSIPRGGNLQKKFPT